MMTIETGARVAERLLESYSDAIRSDSILFDRRKVAEDLEHIAFVLAQKTANFENESKVLGLKKNEHDCWIFQ